MNHDDNIWIGATDQAEEGNWKWTDCSMWNFTNWVKWQPDDFKGEDGNGEDCVVLHGNKSEFSNGLTGWSDLPCNLRELHFVCSKPMCSHSGKAS